MSPTTIRKCIQIAAPVEQVWRYIGTAAGLCEWWGVQIRMQEREGGYFEEEGEELGLAYRRTGRVVVYEPPHQLTLLLDQVLVKSGWPARTKLTVTLEEEDGNTTVMVVHRSLAQEDVAMGATSLSGPKNWQEPTMMMPNQAAGTLPSQPIHPLPATTEALTMHGVYHWQYQQEQLWAQWLQDLSVIITDNKRCGFQQLEAYL